MTKTMLSAAALLIMMSVAVAHAEERHASALPEFAALTRVPQVAPALPLADLQAQHEGRMTWGEVMSGASPIDGILPNGICENGYN